MGPRWSRTTVLSGSKEGQRVVVSGQFLIDSEASLKAAITQLDDGPAIQPPTEKSP